MYLYISLLDFISYMGEYPSLIVTTILTLAVILVNGWTDAPNAIATCVSTRAMRTGPAIFMAAVLNFAGVFVMTLLNQKVAETIYKMVDFRGDAKEALTALCAALIAIVTWATAAWRFGIPTSESHALIAGLSGAAIALQGGFGGIKIKYRLFQRPLSEPGAMLCRRHGDFYDPWKCLHPELPFLRG